MKSHELARKLLEMPDVDVIVPVSDNPRKALDIESVQYVDLFTPIDPDTEQSIMLTGEATEKANKKRVKG